MRELTGSPAIPFKLKDTQGNEHSLGEFIGYWLLMVFHRHLG